MTQTFLKIKLAEEMMKRNDKKRELPQEMNLNNVHIGERNAWHGSEVMALRRNIKLLLNLHINT